MKRALFASVLVVGLSAVAADARAEIEILGVYGIPTAATDTCWGTSVNGTTFGIRVNNCGTDKTIYYPLIYQTALANIWHAQIRASAGVGCAVYAEPDDGGVFPVGSGYGWSSGTSVPVDVAVWTTYTAAFLYCYVPAGGYIVSVKWWLT